MDLTVKVLLLRGSVTGDVHHPPMASRSRDFFVFSPVPNPRVVGA